MPPCVAPVQSQGLHGGSRCTPVQSQGLHEGSRCASGTVPACDVSDLTTDSRSSSQIPSAEPNERNTPRLRVAEGSDIVRGVLARRGGFGVVCEVSGECLGVWVVVWLVALLFGCLVASFVRDR